MNDSDSGQQADRTQERVKYLTVWSIRELRAKRAKDGWVYPNEKVLSRVDPTSKLHIFTNVALTDRVRCTVYLSMKPEIMVQIDIPKDEFEQLPTTRVG